jgi:hypothetical protein
LSRLETSNRTGLEPKPIDAEGRRRIRDATRMWGLSTLGGIAILAVLVIWHLVRRGRLLRDRLGPPRSVGLPNLESREPNSSTMGSTPS